MLLDQETNLGLLASIVQSSQDPIISKNIHGYITSWNQAAEKVLGYSESEAIRQHISLIIPDNRLDEEDAIIASILEGKRITGFKTVRKTKSGKELDVLLTISPLFGKDGRILGASKILHDISAQVALENKLIESNLALQKSNLFKDEFIGLLGHELKTPLTSLKACIELLLNLPDRRDEFVLKALKHANRLGVMINELLDMARAQAGRLEIYPARVNAIEFVQNAIEIVQQGARYHTIALHNDSTASFVMADANRMEQVLINLLSNAVKYSPEADRVLVRVYNKDGALNIVVQDSGLGIPAEEIDKIWTRFYRAQSHRGKFKGMGMGLHLCQQIVQLHKGTIWVKSSEGSGSTFGITLTLVD